MQRFLEIWSSPEPENFFYSSHGTRSHGSCGGLVLRIFRRQRNLKRVNGRGALLSKRTRKVAVLTGVTEYRLDVLNGLVEHFTGSDGQKIRR